MMFDDFSFTVTIFRIARTKHEKYSFVKAVIHLYNSACSSAQLEF